jgi:hypothetical protein
MNLQIQNASYMNHNHALAPINVEVLESKPLRKPFIEANTEDVDLLHLQHDCIIPVFSKDNERTISHQEFIGATKHAISMAFGNHLDLQPEVRVSHTIKGRTPNAMHKKAVDLLEHEKTIYYERMAFAIEIPGFTRDIGGNELTLTVGGVRAYNHENLYNKKSLEHFKFFIGFKNMVCCNMCVSSDGYVENLRASHPEELMLNILEVMRNYHAELHLQQMQQLTQLTLSEQQFAQVLGKCRLHQYLPKEQKRLIPMLQFNDTQVNHVAKDYFVDESFARNEQGDIDLWRMYNLFTGANKNSYIDLFLPRGVNAFELVCGIGQALSDKSSPYRWFID